MPIYVRDRYTWHKAQNDGTGRGCLQREVVHGIGENKVETHKGEWEGKDTTR